MTNGGMKKLLSLVLVMALCVSALCGAIIPANATTCNHDVSTTDGTAIITDTVNGFAVYQGEVCTVCNKSTYQVKPTKLPSETIYWNNTTEAMTLDNSKGTSADNPYIIENAAQLRWLVLNATYNTTNGKYFKIADGIESIILQKSDYVDAIMALDNSNDVKSYFADNTTKELYTWQGTDQITNYQFCGNFDGNGATVYGLYANASYAGLFPCVAEGATIENISVRNSYITANDNAGFIVGRVTCTQAANHKISINKCILANNYIESSKANTYNSIGVMVGMCPSVNIGGTSRFSGVKYNNCLVYGNTAVNTTDGTPLGLIGQVNQSNESCYTNSIILGTTPYPSTKSGYSSHICICNWYKNIYTDADIENAYWKYNGANKMFSNGLQLSEYVKYINPIEAMGEGVVSALSLDSEVWADSTNEGYPELKQNDTEPTTKKDNAYNLLGCNIVYNNDGSFNFNFYYRPNGTTAMPKLYVPQVKNDGTTSGGFSVLEGYKLTETDLEAYKKSWGTDEIALSVGDVRYTIKRLSARDLHNQLLPTAVYYDGNYVNYGETESISIAEYANSIIDGTYATNITTADKLVAKAVVNYGSAAATALTAKDDTAGNTLNWNGKTTEMTLDANKGNSESDPYIVNTAEELAWLVTAGPEKTHGKYFKMADGIDTVVLQPDNTAKIISLANNDKAKEFFEGYSGKKSWVTAGHNESKTFCGHFDGNGVTFYGMYQAADNGLFSAVGCNSTLKNLSIKNSYTTSGWYAAMLASYIDCEYTVDAKVYNDSTGALTIKNVEIANCKMDVNQINGMYNACIGILLGNATNSKKVDNQTISLPCNLVIDGCLVYGNEIFYLNHNDGSAINESCNVLIGSTNGSNSTIRNSVIVDAELFGNVSNRLNITREAYFAVYTNVAEQTKLTNIFNEETKAEISANNQIIVVSDADENIALKGTSAMENMSYLDWQNTFVTGAFNEYPSLIDQSQISTDILYWNGISNADTVLADNGETGDDWDHAIIIDSAEEFAYLALMAGGTYNGSNTTGKYFKMADGIEKIILQPKTAIAKAGGIEKFLELSTAAETKAYFEQDAGFKEWIQSGENWFNGHFDGNGVEFYGMYAKNQRSVGLFPCVDGGGYNATTTVVEPYSTWVLGDDGETYTEVTKYTNMTLADYYDEEQGTSFKNITLKNSYLTSNNRLGGIFSITASPAYGAKVGGTIRIDNCAVYNNYMYSTGEVSTAGVLSGGMGSRDRLEINNCLVYGNDATHNKTSADYNNGHMTICGSLPPCFAKTITDTVDNNGDGVMDIKLDTVQTAENPVIENKITNTISLGAGPLGGEYYYNYNRNFGQLEYVNVYSDFADLEDGTIECNYTTTNEDGTTTTKPLECENATNLVYISDLSTIKGAEATDIVNTLNGETSTVWYVDQYGGYPTFVATAEQPKPISQMTFDEYIEYLDENTVLDVYDDYGVGTMQFGVYATELNLKTNPYISFIFAFNQQYRYDRENIALSLTYTVSGTDYIQSIKVPAYVAGEALNSEGWINGLNNGRYHLYKFEGIPVEALANGITVTASYNGDAVDNAEFTGKFSVEGLGCEFVNAYKSNPCNYYLTRVNATKALLLYVKALELRYGAQ